MIKSDTHFVFVVGAPFCGIHNLLLQLLYLLCGHRYRLQGCNPISSDLEQRTADVTCNNKRRNMTYVGFIILLNFYGVVAPTQVVSRGSKEWQLRR